MCMQCHLQEHLFPIFALGETARCRLPTLWIHIKKLNHVKNIWIKDFYERNTIMETDLFDFANVSDWYGQLGELEEMVLTGPR